MMRALCAALAGTVSVVLGAMPAAAADPHPVVAISPGDPAAFTAAKKALTARIDARLHTLATLTTAITAARYLTPEHASTLSALIDSDVSGLTSLKSAVAGEQDFPAVRADAAAMIDDYRVYVLMVPKVRLTIAADTAAVVQNSLQLVHDRLAAANSASADSDLNDMQDQLSAATVAGVAAALLGTPAGPDEHAIRAKVNDARTAIGTCRADLRRALADAKTAREKIKP